jgi:hypothetical protein
MSRTPPSPLCTTNSNIEFVVANQTTKEVIWLRPLLSSIEISLEKPTMFYGDNQNVI